MGEFKYKLVKEIHSLRTVTIDQYGVHDCEVPHIVHGNYATVQEAAEARKEIASMNPYNYLWKPNDARHEYEIVEIIFLTETIAVGTLAEVTIHAMGLKDK